MLVVICELGLVLTETLFVTVACLYYQLMNDIGERDTYSE